ncbi:MAG: hypothetical protein AAGF84_11460 [Planctomycetota bacterium]
MFAIFNLLVILAVLVIAGIICFIPFAVVWWIAVALIKPKHKWAWRLLCVPAFGIAAVTLLLGVFFWTYRPAAVFEREFGFPPPSDVTELRSKQFILGDSGSVWMNFQADPGTQTLLRNSRAWREPGPNDGSYPISQGEPGWYRVPSATSTETYCVDLTGTTFFTIEEA